MVNHFVVYISSKNEAGVVKHNLNESLLLTPSIQVLTYVLT